MLQSDNGSNSSHSASSFQDQTEILNCVTLQILHSVTSHMQHHMQHHTTQHTDHFNNHLPGNPGLGECIHNNQYNHRAGTGETTLEVIGSKH